MSKNCYFIFKVADKLLFFLLVCTWSWFYCSFHGRIRLEFSFSSYSSFLVSSEICPQPFSVLSMINRAFMCTSFPAGIWITDSVVRHLEKLVTWYRCNTKLAWLVIGPILESTRSQLVAKPSSEPVKRVTCKDFLAKSRTTVYFLQQHFVRGW